MAMVSGWIPLETGDESTGLLRDQWMRAVTVRLLDGRIGVTDRVRDITDLRHGNGERLDSRRD